MISAWLSRVGGTGALLGAACVGGVLAAQSQETVDPGKQKQAIPWTSTCTSQSRGLPAECSLQQRAIVNKTGQVIGMITIRLPSETNKPIMTVQTPLGLFLPAGLNIDVDGEMAQNYPFRSCNRTGCYAGFPITENLLASMFKGGRLNVSFQYVNKRRLTLPMSLVGFSEAYDRIK